MSKKNIKKRSVSAIENGTVIDHINPENTFKILNVLDIHNEEVAIGNNLSSNKMGKKGLLKIANKELSSDELNKIKLFAPDATFCVIKNYEVVKKEKLNLPKLFKGIIKCINPNCITRHQPVSTLFYVLEKDPIKVKCHHCEKIMEKEDIKLL